MDVQYLLQCGANASICSSLEQANAAPDFFKAS